MKVESNGLESLEKAVKRKPTEVLGVWPSQGGEGEKTE